MFYIQKENKLSYNFLFFSDLRSQHFEFPQHHDWSHQQGRGFFVIINEHLPTCPTIYQTEMNISAFPNDSLGLTNVSMNISINHENSSSVVFPYDQRPETYFVPVLFFLIFVTGMIGNGTLVVIFLRHKNMRNVPNT